MIRPKFGDVPGLTFLGRYRYSDSHCVDLWADDGAIFTRWWSPVIQTREPPGTPWAREGERRLT